MMHCKLRSVERAIIWGQPGEGQCGHCVSRVMRVGLAMNAEIVVALTRTVRDFA